MLRSCISIALILIYVPAWGATYYVDATGGNDSNAGTTTNNAWKTISKVNRSSFSAGDSVLFKRGEAWREQLTVSSSGSAGNPITFGAYGSGAKPIISGADIITSWTKEPGTANYYKAGYTANPHGVIKDGTIIENVNTKGELSGSTWWWDDPNDRIYLSFDPSGSTLEIPARLRAILVDTYDYITVDGIESQSGTGSAVYFGVGSDGGIVRNSHIKNFWYGIEGSPTVGNNGLVDNNHVEYGYNGGIIFESTNNASGWVVSNNEVNHCGTILSPQFHSAPSGVMLKFGTGGFILSGNDIHDNGKHKTGDHGAYLESTTGAIVKFNKFHGNSAAGLKLYILINPLVYYNLMYENGFGITYQTNSTGGKIWNNTVYNNSGSDIGHGLHISATATLAELYNNIFSENEYGGSIGSGQIYVEDKTCSITASDHNLVYYRGAGDIISYQGVGATWAKWQGLGFDSAGVNADPLFTDRGNGDFTLQAGSPAINAGTTISGMTSDNAGKRVPNGSAPDIGAYEYISSSTVPSPPSDIIIQ